MIIKIYFLECEYNLVIRFTNETHTFKYNYPLSMESLALADKICKNVSDFSNS